MKRKPRAEPREIPKLRMYLYKLERTGRAAKGTPSNHFYFCGPKWMEAGPAFHALCLARFDGNPLGGVSLQDLLDWWRELRAAYGA